MVEALGVRGASEAATLRVSQSRPLFLSLYMWMFLRGNAQRARVLPGFACLCELYFSLPAQSAATTAEVHRLRFPAILKAVVFRSQA